MKSEPLVSIIMPAYNTEKYIKESIESVIRQTYKNWELLVIDDHSTDNTKEIIKTIADTDKRVKPIYADINSKSPAKAKNIVLPLARGEFIAFLDSDDIWLEDKLTRQISIMNNNKKYALTYTGGYWIDENGYEIKKFLPKYKCGFLLKKMLQRYEINNQSVVIKRAILGSLSKKFNENIVIGEDYNLFMNIVAQYEVCNIKEYLIKYRVHSNSITNSKIFDLSDGTLKTLKELDKKYKIKLKYPLCYFTTWLKAIRFKLGIK